MSTFLFFLCISVLPCDGPVGWMEIKLYKWMNSQVQVNIVEQLETEVRQGKKRKLYRGVGQKPEEGVMMAFCLS